MVTITAPTGDVAKIDAVTLGTTNDQDYHLGVKNNTYEETQAIVDYGGGEIKGPWTVDDSEGLVIENTTSTAAICSYRGVVE